MDGRAPLRGDLRIEDPKDFPGREKLARSCAARLRFSMPMLIDDMDDKTARAYGAYPDRLYLIGKDGNVRYRGSPGPGGFKPDELEEHLKRLPAPGQRIPEPAIWL